MKLDGKSMNIIEQNIEKLKEIFPEVFSEGKIDFSKLEEELGSFKTDENERYNFTWNGKSEAKKIALTPSTGTLRPCKEESKDWDTTQNLYIEGDNLEVLKLLQKSYHKKVKMIYIDPPYNTGKDFVYKDNFRDNIKNYLEITGQVDSDGNKLSTNSETSGRYHSDWLNMMYPRLKLARNLLKDDGVIFISIDDNEVANLRKLCDEIFGEDNFVAQIPWFKSYGKNESNFFSNNIEYIFCYAKNIDILNHEDYHFYILKEGFHEVMDLVNNLKNKNISFKDAEKKLREFYKINAHLKGIKAYNNVDENYKIWRPVSMEKPKDPCYFYDIIHPITKLPCKKPKKGWRMPENTAMEYLGNNLIIFGESHETVPNRKYFLEDVKFETPKNFIANSDQGGNDIGKLFNDNQSFDFPKPISIMEYLIKLYQDKNILILDFFSGSATTAHAIMKLNSEDDGNRKFICVQLPEPIINNDYKTICEIGKERIRRAGEKVKSESGKTELDIGFKVLKLDSSNIKSWDSDFENLETNLLDAVENIKSDRNEEDLLYEILLKYGLDLTLPIEEKEVNGKKLYNIGFGALIICLDSNISIDITDEIIAIKKEYDSEITRVVFKDSGFKNATEKTNIIKTLNQNGIDEVVSV
ncbi:site-specific DNA-methyltransferase [Aliarcobacter butzleri]|uniref:site-specific DNA-methyltransferase n=1 Tax=Aliarcobacter butzleri TaxID=28197 RepID=UPI001260E30C|nr:site-specific DNA-methyltransferase [Aliarcobacter butzleri]